jgi:hypothetical protein
MSVEAEKIVELAQQAGLESKRCVQLKPLLGARWNYPKKMVALSYPQVRCS